MGHLSGVGSFAAILRRPARGGQPHEPGPTSCSNDPVADSSWRLAEGGSDNWIARAVQRTRSRGGGAIAIRVCVVTETYPPEINGVAMTLSHLVDGLRARGHQAVVRPRQPGGSRAVDLRDPGLTLVRGVSMPRYDGVQLGLPAGALLRRQWTEQRPDVVYVATEGPLGRSAVRAAHQLGLAVLSGFPNFHG
jgi:hypothetical protein